MRSSDIMRSSIHRVLSSSRFYSVPSCANSQTLPNCNNQFIIKTSNQSNQNDNLRNRSQSVTVTQHQIRNRCFSSTTNSSDTTDQTSTSKSTESKLSASLSDDKNKNKAATAVDSSSSTKTESESAETLSTNTTVTDIFSESCVTNSTTSDKSVTSDTTFKASTANVNATISPKPIITNPNIKKGLNSLNHLHNPLSLANRVSHTPSTSSTNNRVVLDFDPKKSLASSTGPTTEPFSDDSDRNKEKEDANDGGDKDRDKDDDKLKGSDKSKDGNSNGTKEEESLNEEDLDEPKPASMMTPPELVAALDKHIIGQHEAKRAMASAIRYRWRRKQLHKLKGFKPEYADDVTPRNILMIGPTGSGKTEIARRLAKLLDAPFTVSEATKFTEVGFHGRDIESVMRDLVEAGIRLWQKKLEKEYRPLALEAVENKLLEALLGELQDEASRETWLGHLRRGWVDDRLVQVDIPVNTNNSGGLSSGFGGAGGGGGSGGGGFGGSGSGGFSSSDSFSASPTGSGSDSYGGSGSLGGSGSSSGSRSFKTRRQRLPLKEAREKLLQAELDLRISPDEVVTKALESVQSEGIVFLDEIDKICSPKGSYGPDASSEGVQRDLLPIIEGTVIPTKFGSVRSDHVLFVCAGSFHSVRPSDMLAELQGRLPIRMHLHPLTEHDFFRILTEPEFGICHQIQALLLTEGCELILTECGLKQIAKSACDMNTYIENIGARRLHTILAKVTDELSFKASEYNGQTVMVNREFVMERLKDVEIDKTAKGLL